MKSNQIKFPNATRYQATSKGSLAEHRGAFNQSINQSLFPYYVSWSSGPKESAILAGNVTTEQHQKEILLNTKGQYKKESNILVVNANIKQHQKDILLNTKGQHMKESDILTGNATIKQQQKEILLNTKEQYMKE